MADIDDGSIADDHDLLRRIRPDQVIDDENLGMRRPSSAAFKDPQLSVDSERIIIENGQDWRFSLREHPGYSLARFKAGAARQAGLPVIHMPLEENPAHTEIHGKKTQRIANILFAACSWVHLEPKR